MIGELRGRELATLAALAAAGVTGALVAVGGRNAEPELVRIQRNPPALQAREVERVVRTAPDPILGKGRGDSARCSRRGPGLLGNPWTCTVSYPSGRRVRITVRVHDDGTYEGRYAGGGGASGCCIDLPGAR